MAGNYVEHRTLAAGALFAADSTLQSGERKVWIGADDMHGRWVTHAEFRQLVALLTAFADGLPPHGVAPDAEAPHWRQAFERAMKQAYGAVDPFKPAGQPGSYWRGEHNGIVGALQTLRENFERELTRGVDVPLKGQQ